MDKIALGQYIPGDSFIHRMDPRSKLISAIWFIILIFMATTWWTYGLLIAVVLLSTVLSKIPLKFYLNSLKPLALLLFITVIFQLIFSQGETVLFEFGWVNITQ